MLATLRRVRGAVSDRPTVIALTHFFFNDGRIQGNNARFAIDAPLDFVANRICVPAAAFTRAIDSCGDNEPTLELRDGHLLLRAGRLRIKLPTLDAGQYPSMEPDPVAFEPEAPLLPVLSALAPFIAEDANQVWPMGVWLSDAGFAYATNNIILLRYACDFMANTGHDINLPGSAVEELVRIGEEPVEFGVSANSVTFYFADGSWLKSQLIDKEWPVETLDKLYAGAFGKAAERKFKDVPEDLRPALEALLPFCPEPKFPVVILGEDSVRTEDGASAAAFEGFQKLPPSRFNGNFLQLVLGVAQRWQVAPDGGRAYFITRDDGRGMIAGVRQV